MLIPQDGCCLLSQMRDDQPLLPMSPPGRHDRWGSYGMGDHSFSTHKSLVLPALQVPAMVKAGSLPNPCICMSKLDGPLSVTGTVFSLLMVLWAARI